MKSLPKVFVSEPINSKGIEMLEGKAQIVLAPDTRKETALALICDADAAILRATTTFDKEMISKGVNLKAIVRTGVGIDNVDLKFAAEKGIFVCNTPGTNDETVAEHVVAMILAFAKQIIVMDKAVRNQNWKERFSLNQIDIKNKKLGIIGYGNIGFSTAHICRCLGMQVTAYDPFITQTGIDVNITDNIETIFKESDFVSLHCPSTPLTRKFIGEKYLSLMKKGAYLINTSRGDLIDENALVKALNQNRLAGAALDVFKEEPLSANSPLLSLPNVILSPHVAGSTKESNERIAIAAAQAVLDTFNGKRPLNICNIEYFSDDQKMKVFA